MNAAADALHMFNERLATDVFGLTNFSGSLELDPRISNLLRAARELDEEVVRRITDGAARQLNEIRADPYYHDIPCPFGKDDEASVAAIADDALAMALDEEAAEPSADPGAVQSVAQLIEIAPGLVQAVILFTLLGALILRTGRSPGKTAGLDGVDAQLQPVVDQAVLAVQEKIQQAPVTPGRPG